MGYSLALGNKDRLLGGRAPGVYVEWPDPMAPKGGWHSRSRSGSQLLLSSTLSSTQTEKSFENYLLARAAFSPQITTTLGF